MKQEIVAALAAMCLLAPGAALAQVAPDPAFSPVELADIRHREASLTIVDATGMAHVYTPADLEGLPTYMVETTTPWRETPARFEGVLLSDLLERHGLIDTPRLQVIAENDFVSEMDREVWQTGAIMIATRVDGAAHTRRARGPIQFVIPMQRYSSEEVLAERHLVWMAAEIRPAE